MPKVSIIMPLFNQEKYIDECLISVINQTLKDIEIIVVNDGSTDNSLSIVKEYATRDKRIIVIDKPNSGYGHTMNVGMDAASGEYIGIVETDDFVKLDMFEKLYNAAKEFDCDIVKANYCRFTGDNKNRKFVNMCIEHNEEFYNKLLYLQREKKLFHFSMTWSGIYKTELLRKNNICHNETPGASYQDNGFWLKSYSFADRIYYLPDYFYMYRFDNPNSSINNRNKIFSVMEEFKLNRNFLKSNPEIEKLRVERFNIEKFYCYTGTLNRIDINFRLDFIKKYSEEINESVKNNEINLSKLGNVGLEMQKIISSPENYYSENLKSSLISKQNILENQKNKIVYLEEEIRTIKKSLSYKIARAITFVPRNFIILLKYIKKYGLSYTIRHSFEKILKIIFPKYLPYGIKRHSRKIKVIISLTSIPKRIDTLNLCIETLLNQTMKPDILILWLANEQFVNKEKDLPSNLLKLKGRGLTIDWCEDLKPHKKYFFTMKKYSKDIIITVDDDIFYDKDIVKKLYKSYKKFPNAVSALRVHQITFDDKGNIQPYKDWKFEDDSLLQQPSNKLFATGVSGVLYPPQSLNNELFNITNLKNTCLMTDDIWLKIMGLANNTPIVLADYNTKLNYIRNTQENALWKSNITNGNNDINLANTLEIYNNFFDKNISLIDKIKQV